MSERLWRELIPGRLSLHFILVLRLGLFLFRIARPSSVGVPLVYSLSNIDQVREWNVQDKVEKNTVKLIKSWKSEFGDGTSLSAITSRSAAVCKKFPWIKRPEREGDITSRLKQTKTYFCNEDAVPMSTDNSVTS